MTLLVDIDSVFMHMPLIEIMQVLLMSVYREVAMEG